MSHSSLVWPSIIFFSSHVLLMVHPIFFQTTRFVLPFSPCIYWALLFMAQVRRQVKFLSRLRKGEWIWMYALRHTTVLLLLFSWHEAKEFLPNYQLLLLVGHCCNFYLNGNQVPISFNCLSWDHFRANCLPLLLNGNLLKREM